MSSWARGMKWLYVRRVVSALGRTGRSGSSTARMRSLRQDRAKFFSSQGIPFAFVNTKAGSLDRPSRDLLERRSFASRSASSAEIGMLRALLFLGPTTWYRLTRRRGWSRPLTRVHPPKPKIGVRATAPGELLHLDVTVIKLLDGTRTFLHAIIDNYSRRILSWTLESRLGSGATCRVLREAAMEIAGKVEGALLVSDAGSERVQAQGPSGWRRIDRWGAGYASGGQGE